MNFTILNMCNDINKGDLAIVESTLCLIKKNFPQSNIVLLNSDYAEEEITIEGKFNHIKKLPVRHLGSVFPRVFRKEKNAFVEMLRGVWYLMDSLWILLACSSLKGNAYHFITKKNRAAVQSIYNADRIILKGGSYLYSYGGPKQLLFLFRMLLTSIIAICFHKKIIALGHSIGPIHGTIAKYFLTSCIKRFDKIVLREKVSYDFLCGDLKIDIHKIDLLADLAFWSAETGPILNIENQILKQENIEILQKKRYKFGLTILDWNILIQRGHKLEYGEYVKMWADIIDYLYVEFQADFYIMPQSLRDIPLNEEISFSTEKVRPYVLRGDYSTAVLRQLYGLMDIFLGMRTHSIIFALSSGIPAIAVAYEAAKGFGIVEMIEGPEYVLDFKSLNPEAVLEKVGTVLRENEIIKPVIVRRVQNIKTDIDNKFRMYFAQ